MWLDNFTMFKYILVLVSRVLSDVGAKKMRHLVGIKTSKKCCLNMSRFIKENLTRLMLRPSYRPVHHHKQARVSSGNSQVIRSAMISEIADYHNFLTKDP